MLTAQIPSAQLWVIASPLVAPFSLGHPADRRLLPTLPARRNTLLSVRPAAKPFGYINSSVKFTCSSLVLPSCYVTTTVPRPFRRTPPTIHRASILTFVTTLSASALRMVPLPFGVSPVMTMLPTSSLRHCPAPISLAYGLTLDFGDACARRSFSGWRFDC